MLPAPIEVLIGTRVATAGYGYMPFFVAPGFTDLIGFALLWRGQIAERTSADGSPHQGSRRAFSR